MNELIIESNIIDEKPKPKPRPPPKPTHKLTPREKKILTVYYDITDVRHYRHLINGWSNNQHGLNNAKEMYDYLYRYTDLKIFDNPRKMCLTYFLFSIERQTDRPIYWHGDPLVYSLKNQPRFIPN